MASPRHPVSSASQRPASAQTSEKADPNKPLKNARAGENDSNTDLGNPYFPRYGSAEAHHFFVKLGIEDFLARQTGKNALRLAKAWSAFINATLGVGSVGRPRVDVTFLQTLMDPDLAPDVGESDFKSKSLGAEWNDHYARVAAQAARGGSSTYSA